MLATVARSGGDQGRRDDLAGVTPPLDGAVQDVAGPAGFVAAAELTVFRYSAEETAQLGLVVRELLDDGGCVSVLREDRDHHGVLVDIHPDVNLAQSRYGHGSVLLGLRL